MAETEKIKVVEVDTSKTESALKRLRKEMKELDSAYLEGKVSEEQYRKETERLESTLFQVTDTHKDAKLAIADFGVQMKNVATIGKSLSAGLTAVQAGLNAMGIESGAVADKISKLQNLQALTQAFTAMKDDGVKAFKGLSNAIGLSSKGLGGFKKALIATGLGALVVILGSIIANWDEFTEAIGVSEDAMNKLGEVFGGVMNVIKKSTAGIAKAFAKVFTGDFSGALDELKNGFDVVANYNEGVQQKIEEREKEATEKKAEEWEKQRKILEENLKAELALKESAEADGWKQSEEGKKYMDEYFRKRLSLYAKDSNEYKAILTEKNNYDKEYTKNQQSELDKQTEAMRKAHEEQDKLRADDFANISDILNRVAESQNSAQQNELNKLYDQYEQEKALLEQYGIDTADLTEWYESEKDKIKEKYKEKDVQTTEKTEEEKKGIFKNATDESVKQVQEQVNNTSSLASSVSDILSSFADAQDQDNREGFERAKKIQIATATIQMLQGIATAIAGAYTTKTGPWDIALAASQAAAIGVSGAVQIAKIKKQTYNSSSSSSGASATPSFTATTALNDPSLTTKQLVSDSESEALQRDTKVYVTESDITSTTNKVSVMESENAM